MNPELLSGKVAIVTGGACGLGRATVERFVAEGASVVIADIDAPRGEELAARLGSRARFLHADVSDADQVQAVVDCAVSAFGGLDIMFNNAGISEAVVPRFVDDNLADFHKVVNVNLLGVMLGSQRAARYMKDHGGGVIINNASIGGRQAGFGVMSYRATKAAVIHFTRCIAIDFAEYGIRVNCISPAHIETGISAAFRGPGMTQEQVERIDEALRPLRRAGQPLKRTGMPEDVANAALYLASELSAQTTGMELVVDGGVTAGDPVNHFNAVFEVLRQMLPAHVQRKDA